MAKTAAERQRAYRRRRQIGDKRDRRLNTWVSVDAALALERLARRDGVTQRAILERLVVAADRAVLDALKVDTPEWHEYFGLPATGHQDTQEPPSPTSSGWEAGTGAAGVSLQGAGVGPG